MPLRLSFTKRLGITNRDKYINTSCVGGDQVVDLLLPAVKLRYTDIASNQDEWCWSVWCRKGKVRLGIEVYADDADAGAFRVHLISRVRGIFWAERDDDTPELDELRTLVEAELKQWIDSAITIEQIAG